MRGLGVAFCLTTGVAFKGAGLDFIVVGVGETLSLINLWVGSRALFIAGLAAYLFFVVVVVSKLAHRGGGALRRPK